MTTTYDTVRQAGQELARQLAEHGHGRAVVEPGNGARYDVYVQTGEHPGQLVVTLPDWRAGYTFVPGWVHWSYVAEKLRMTQPDAQVVADLLEYTGEELARLRAPVTVTFDEDGTVTEVR